jgi:hypothetical protein
VIDLLKGIFFRPEKGPDLSPMLDMDVKQQDSAVALFGRLYLILKGYDMAKEVPKNRGGWIDQINSSIGAPLGSPYCLSGLLYCLKSLEAATGCKFDLPRVPGTQYFWNLTKDEYKVQMPSPWCIGIMQHRKDPRHGHAVIVVNTPDHYGYFETFEFNTDISGSRDGDGAMFTKRHLTGTAELRFLGFVDLSKALKT